MTVDVDKDENPQRWLPPSYISMGLFIFLVWLNYNTDAGDFAEFQSWLVHIADVGPHYALGHPFSGYSPPYIYALTIVSPAIGWVGSKALIKLVSYIGYIMLAFAVRHLLIVAGRRDANRAAALFLLVPSLFANFAIMNQCDAFWGAGIVMATAAAIRGAHGRMFFWFGLAVAFKLQAAFAGPCILAVALARSVPVRWWLLAPAATTLAYVPAWLTGWPMIDLLFVYFRQTGFFSNLSLNAPNIWMIVQWDFPGRSWDWLTMPATVAAILACLIFMIWSMRYLRHANTQMTLLIFLIGFMIPPSILPRMHERYFFAVDIMAIVLSILDIKKYWKVTTLVQIGTTLSIIAHLTQLAIFSTVGAYAMLAAIWLAMRMPKAITGNCKDPHPPSPAPWQARSARPARCG